MEIIKTYNGFGSKDRSLGFIGILQVLSHFEK